MTTPTQVLSDELKNIANAKRFNREHFADDTEFADWAQNRARAALAQPSAAKDAPAAPAQSGEPTALTDVLGDTAVWSHADIFLTRVKRKGSPGYHGHHDELMRYTRAVIRAALDAIYLAAPDTAPQPSPVEAGDVEIPDECVASGALCSYVPEGRHGEMQCRYCGNAKQPAVPLDDERAACDTAYKKQVGNRRTDENDFGAGWECAIEWIQDRTSDAAQADTAEPKRGTSAQIQLERQITREAIEGAIAFGYQNTNPPPSDDHWLAPFWKIGRKQAELESHAPAQTADVQSLRRIASELRAYNPAADEYKGRHIHKVWAREIDAALSQSTEGK